MDKVLEIVRLNEARGKLVNHYSLGYIILFTALAILYLRRHEISAN